MTAKRFRSARISRWNYLGQRENACSQTNCTQFKRELYLSKLHPPGKLLDFGCADGHLADTFSGFDYYGVDIDPVAIEAARRRFRDRPNMHFIAADLCARPFPPDEFDEILFACTIH